MDFDTFDIFNNHDVCIVPKSDNFETPTSDSLFSILASEMNRDNSHEAKIQTLKFYIDKYLISQEACDNTYSKLDKILNHFITDKIHIIDVLYQHSKESGYFFIWNKFFPQLENDQSRIDVLKVMMKKYVDRDICKLLSVFMSEEYRIQALEIHNQKYKVRYPMMDDIMHHFITDHSRIEVIKITYPNFDRRRNLMSGDESSSSDMTSTLTPQHFLKYVMMDEAKFETFAIVYHQDDINNLISSLESVSSDIYKIKMINIMKYDLIKLSSRVLILILRILKTAKYKFEVLRIMMASGCNAKLNTATQEIIPSFNSVIHQKGENVTFNEVISKDGKMKEFFIRYTHNIGTTSKKSITEIIIVKGSVMKSEDIRWRSVPIPKNGFHGLNYRSKLTDTTNSSSSKSSVSNKDKGKDKDL